MVWGYTLSQTPWCAQIKACKCFHKAPTFLFQSRKSKGSSDVNSSKICLPSSQASGPSW